jgi:uncharacterized phiE125 gp8 family phage protein
MRSGPIDVVTPPAAGDPVITVSEAKAHLRWTQPIEDDLIARLVAHATQLAQTRTRRQLVTATLAMRLDALPACGLIEIPLGPVQAVSSITYVDEAGATQTLASSLYDVDIYSEPSRITIADGATWPSTKRRTNAVTVTFTAGYGAAAAVPDGIKSWMHLQVAALFRNREAFAQGVSVTELPGGFVDGMLDPYTLRLP